MTLYMLLRRCDAMKDWSVFGDQVRSSGAIWKWMLRRNGEGNMEGGRHGCFGLQGCAKERERRTLFECSIFVEPLPSSWPRARPSVGRALGRTPLPGEPLPFSA